MSEIKASIAAGETDTAQGWIESLSFVSKATVAKWLAQHDASLSEFVGDNGERDQYRSDQVFGWLGY